MSDLGVNEITAGNLIGTIRGKGIIETVGKKDRIAIYTFHSGALEVKPKPDIPSIDPHCFRKVLQQTCSSTSQLGKTCTVLLELWDQGVQSFHYNMLMEKLDLTAEQIHKVLYQVKLKGFLRSDEMANGSRLYTFTVENNSSNKKPASKKIEYSHDIIASIQSLVHSSSSPKDRRIGEVLTSCLAEGVVRRKDYDKFGKPERWSYDMGLAARMGLVEKESNQVYRILQELRPGPGELLPAQKEMATALYHNFGNEFFSSEMVIATLDYSSAHVCASLHQFTLLKILQCNKENNNTYQFIVNPKENPECFADVA